MPSIETTSPSMVLNTQNPQLAAKFCPKNLPFGSSHRCFPWRIHGTNGIFTLHEWLIVYLIKPYTLVSGLVGPLFLEVLFQPYFPEVRGGGGSLNGNEEKSTIHVGKYTVRQPWILWEDGLRFNIGSFSQVAIPHHPHLLPVGAPRPKTLLLEFSPHWFGAKVGRFGMIQHRSFIVPTTFGSSKNPWKNEGTF